MQAHDVMVALPGPLRSPALTLAGWVIYRRRFNKHFFTTLLELERSVTGPLEVLHGVQRRKLFAWIDRARHHVPFYRDLPPTSEKRDALAAIEETLASIPPLEKESYSANPRAFLSDDVPGHRLHRSRTSGTTGTALPLWHTQDTLAEEYATIWRMYRSYGVQLRDPKMTFGGNIIAPFSQERPPFWHTNHYEGQTLFSSYHLRPRNLHAYVSAIHDTPARYAQGYPSSLNLVARALLDAGRPLPARRLAAVFPSSERLLASHRATIEEAFAAPVANRYGSSEFAVSMTSCELNFLHVDMEFCIVEVEPEEETDDWVRGSLLVTGLAPGAIPFLRYRIGDVGTRSKKPCPCGRPGDVFLDVDGRMDDYVVTSDGRSVGRLDHIFKDLREICEAQIYQEEKGAIEVRVVPRLGYTAASEARLRQEIRKRLGADMRVAIKQLESIPREKNGKFRAVKSSLADRAA